jgi:hypothetical protein
MGKMRVLVLTSLVAIVAFTGCRNPINPGLGGTLTVSMNDAVSRTILPGISMNPASYDLAGTGPNGASFSQSVSSGTSATMTNLAFGDWTVTATAKNGAGTAIGQGSGSVTVLSNASVSLSITVQPYDGFGTLALDVSWPATQVQSAQIQSTLTPASGPARDLAFAVNGGAGTANFSATDVATGYHTLMLKLLDNGHLAIGAVEVVRIVKDQTTSGTLAFTIVNQATGTLEVNLTPEMADPLQVSIAGGAATKPANQSLALSATVSNYSGNVTYVWYVNGDAVAIGASYDFGDTWSQGYYRIDVTAFSADGKRAGSATTDVEVPNAYATVSASFNSYRVLATSTSFVANDSSLFWLEDSGITIANGIATKVISDTTQADYSATIRLATDGDGTLYMASREWGVDNQLLLSRYDEATNSWSNVISDGSIGAANRIDMVVSGDKIYICYDDYGVGARLYVKEYDVRTGELVTLIQSDATEFYQHKMWLDPTDGLIFLVYSQYNSGVYNLVKINPGLSSIAPLPSLSLPNHVAKLAGFDIDFSLCRVDNALCFAFSDLGSDGKVVIYSFDLSSSLWSSSPLFVSEWSGATPMIVAHGSKVVLVYSDIQNSFFRIFSSDNGFGSLATVASYPTVGNTTTQSALSSLVVSSDNVYALLSGLSANFNSLVVKVRTW